MDGDTGAEHEVIAKLAPGDSASLHTSPGHVFVTRPIDGGGENGRGGGAAARRFEVTARPGAEQAFHLHDDATEL